MFVIKNLLLFLFLNANSLYCNNIFPHPYRSEPIVSVDTIKTLADFILDMEKTFEPKNVFEGAVVFVKTDFFERFFKEFHPKIPSKYILISHDGDLPAPREFVQMLADPKLIAWLGQNPTIKSHKKFHPIPIGIAGKIWRHGNTNIIKKIQNLDISRNHLAYLNIATSTYPQERKRVQRQFHNKNYCLHKSKCTFEEYLLDLKQSFFVFSPRGNGLDCHRTWEAMLMGAIPIVKTSTLDPLLEGLPVLIVKDWKEVDREFLGLKYLEFLEKDFSLDKLYLPYWKNFIRILLENEGIFRK